MAKYYKKLLSGLISLSIITMSLPTIEVSAETGGEDVQSFINLSGEFNNHITHNKHFYPSSQAYPFGTTYGNGDDSEVGLIGNIDYIYRGDDGALDYSLMTAVDPVKTCCFKVW